MIQCGISNFDSNEKKDNRSVEFVSHVCGVNSFDISRKKFICFCTQAVIDTKNS